MKAKTPKTESMTLPEIGQFIRDKENGGTRKFKVVSVFPAGQYPGMILEWDTDYNPSTGKAGKRGQVFTTKNWADRWEVV